MDLKGSPDALRGPDMVVAIFRLIYWFRILISFEKRALYKDIYNK